MHKMCYLLAAKRREYPDLPCVTLYHGEVAGTALQNDQAVERGTGISITIDDLADIGADYYALGHIHKPQRVGSLPAYYAGSVYPKNFGETHRAGFYIADAEAGSCTVHRYDFPHPQNMKIETTLDGFLKKTPYSTTEADGLDFDGGNEVRGKKVWLEISCDKARRSFVKAEAELQKLLEHGAVEGSRVTIRDIPVETVRAAEITEVNTPAKKFRVWAENSGVEAAESVAGKIEALETEIRTGAAKAAGEWELVSVKLRGAYGIRKGIDRDEIHIDFGKYENGLIAVTGANGKGKTTLIENCHPYPQLLTRKGKLQDHFTLRDGYREVVYADRSPEGAGRFVKFLIQIDGQNKSGSCKHFIFDARGPAGLASITEWVPRPGVDGNLKPYEDELAAMFGPLDLYMRTAHIAQRPTKNLPDLADATAGEKKALFVELAGIDYLRRFCEAANEKAKLEDNTVRETEIRMQPIRSMVAGKDGELRRLRQSRDELKSSEALLEDITAKGREAKADMEKRREAWNAEQTRRDRETSARLEMDGLREDIASLTSEMSRYREAAKNREAYEKDLAEHENVRKTIDAENEKKRGHLEDNLGKQQRFQKEKAAHDEKAKALETELQGLRGGQHDLERLISDSHSKIKLYERDAAEINEDCPTCEQRLPSGKLGELKAGREAFLAKFEAEKDTAQRHSESLCAALKRISEVGDRIADLSLDEPSAPHLPQFDDTALRAATERRSLMADESQIRENLERAKEAAVRIEGIEKLLADRSRSLNEKAAFVKSLTEGIGEGTGARLRAELDSAISLHEELTAKYTETKERIAGHKASAESTERALADIEARERELAALEERGRKAVAEHAEWELVARAFGKDGIQALELDALAPGISDTANRILESAYGDRFRIAIETTRIGGSGKKTKQVEDFIIKVIDGEDGEAVNLEDKSGGEAVWIKRAIYDAFAVIRRRNTGFAFLSCFQDEADGALDGAAKTAYCRMLEAAHAEGNMRHTFVITHSNEVRAMIDQRIDMEELGAAA